MTDQYSRSPPSSPPQAGRDTADEHRPMIELGTLVMWLVLAVLSLCWLALYAHMYIFGDH
jgi:hypothetical protein